MSKLDDYAKTAIQAMHCSFHSAEVIKLLVGWHYPKNLRQWAADQILLRVVEDIEYRKACDAIFKHIRSHIIYDVWRKVINGQTKS